jgi:hypothetical protein
MTCGVGLGKGARVGGTTYRSNSNPEEGQDDTKGSEEDADTKILVVHELLKGCIGTYGPTVVCDQN